MSSIVNQFNIFRDFPKQLKQNIKLFHVFEDNITFCVTNDDKVFGFGVNTFAFLGYNRSNDNKSYFLIQELCDKKIEVFFGFKGVYFARSELGDIYTWGDNHEAQLGLGFKSDEYHKPKRNEFLSDKNIIQIKYYFCHCLALGSDRKVYKWGLEMFEKSIDLKNFQPIVLTQLTETIKSINCAGSQSFALTFSGKIFCYNNEKYMDWEIPGEQIIDLFYETGIYCQTNESLYVRRDENWIKIDYKNPFEYYFIRYKMTYKTIYLKNNEFFSIDYYLSEESNEVKKSLELIYFNKFDSKLTISSTIVRDLPKTLKSDVKCFYKSKDFEFLVKNDSSVTVYVRGFDMVGKLGLGANIKQSYDFSEIVELRFLGIEEFFEGNNCMFARSEENVIYYWGLFEKGQLVRQNWTNYEPRSKIRKDYLRPKKDLFLSDKNIIDISFGDYHCLALSSDGKVYGWGSNENGQIGCGQSHEEYVFHPFFIDFDFPIKYINCGKNRSFAVDINGSAFYWGEDSNQIQWKPKKIFVKNVKKIENIYLENECIVLKESGNVFIYSFDENRIMCQIIVGLKVNDIFGYLCETDECVHTLSYYESIYDKTNFFNFYEYYSWINNNVNSYKTIHVKTETNDGQEVKYLTTKEIQLNPEYNRQTNEDILIFEEKNVFNRKFQNTFVPIGRLGEGSFGEVFKVREKATQDLFAIKRIEMKGNISFNIISDELNLYNFQINGNTI